MPRRSNESWPPRAPLEEARIRNLQREAARGSEIARNELRAETAPRVRTPSLVWSELPSYPWNRIIALDPVSPTITSSAEEYLRHRIADEWWSMRHFSAAESATATTSSATTGRVSLSRGFLEDWWAHGRGSFIESEPRLPLMSGRIHIRYGLTMHHVIGAVHDFIWGHHYNGDTSRLERMRVSDAVAFSKYPSITHIAEDIFKHIHGGAEPGFFLKGKTPNFEYGLTIITPYTTMQFSLFPETEMDLISTTLYEDDPDDI